MQVQGAELVRHYRDLAFMGEKNPHRAEDFAHFVAEDALVRIDEPVDLILVDQLVEIVKRGRAERLLDGHA